MIYQFLQKLVRLVVGVFFRKIFFSGSENIPLHKPVILACNHPNSFLDAVLLAVLIKKPIHFLTRSDVFNSPFKRWLLGKLHLIPIYRLEEGSQNLHKNQDTFARCYEILQQNGIVLIFSEGLCVMEKRLRPLRKGTARLAFGAEEAHGFNLDLQVVPVGINYTYPDQFRREVLIGVAPAIPVNIFRSEYEVNPAKAFRSFNQQLEAGLREQMIIIERPEDEPILEQLFIRQRLQSPLFYTSAGYSESNSILENEKNLCKEFRNSTEYIINSESVKSKNNVNNQFKLKSFLLWLGLPIFLLGLLFNFIPLLVASVITRWKVKLPEFHASVLMVLGMVLYLLFLILMLVIATSLWGFAGLGALCLIPALGYAALRWWDKYRFLQLLGTN